MKPALAARVTSALGEALGRAPTILGEEALSGGDISTAVRLATSAGTFFLKTNATVLPGFFTAEAAGLRALAGSGTSLVVPEVLAAEDPAPGTPGFIVTTYLEPSPRAGASDEAFGRGLAALHRATRFTFGFDVDTYCGTTPQPNGPVSPGRWADFYAEHRLGHLVSLGARRRIFEGADLRTLERLVARLPELLAAPEEPPALIHGDLWSGNLLATAKGPAIIDPAAYYGHREAELGMMRLFGGFSARVYDAYDEASPLAPGWEDRNELYVLYHLLNHALLFGGSYVRSALALARRYA